MKVAAEKRKAMDIENRVSSIAKQLLPDTAKKRFAKIFSEMIINHPKNNPTGVFYNDYNNAVCNDVNFSVVNDTLVCTFDIDLPHHGYGINSMDAVIMVGYPETIETIENMIKEEYQIPGKVILNVKCSFLNSGSGHIFIHENKMIKLMATKTNDLTSFCHLLNCWKGTPINAKSSSSEIDVFYLYIDGTTLHSSGTNLQNFKLSTSEPLNNKFQYIKLNNFGLNQIENLSDILSSKLSSNYFQAKLVYTGRNPIFMHDYTGAIELNLPATNYLNSNTPYSEFFYIKSLMKEVNKFAKRNTDFSNLRVRLKVDPKAGWSSAITPLSKPSSKLTQDTVKNLEEEDIDNIALTMIIQRHKFIAYNETQYQHMST